MGGIVAAVSLQGQRVSPLIRRCLERMFFRGNDCAGIATAFGGKLFIKKGRGTVSEVHERLNLDDMPGSVGIGHTRFSTHGRPHLDNAHPHTGCFQRIAVVGDGAIANYEELRDSLVMEGHRLVSRCDFEVIAHLAETLVRSGMGVLDCVREIAKRVEGFYSYALLDAERELAVVYTTRQPMYVGVSRECIVAASSQAALLDLVDTVIELRGGEAAILSSSGIEVYDVETGRIVQKDAKPLTIDRRFADKDGYPHHMLREIYEIPYAMMRLLSTVQKRYLSFAARLVNGAREIYIIGDGTSLHAGYLASYYFTELAGISPIVVSAAEFPLYHVENVGPGTVVIAISQSGETGDVIRSAYEAKLRGATILGITNYISSRLANLSNLYLPIAAGPELAVPATKTFINTLMLLYMLSLRAAQEKGRVSSAEIRDKLRELERLATTLQEELPRLESLAEKAARIVAECRSGYVISRGITYPIAMEGALKLKEAAYIHAEGMEAGEFLHGPIVLVEKGFFTIFVIPVERAAAKATYPLVSSSFEKGASVVTIGFAGDPELDELPGALIRVPPADRHVAPMVYAIPLQLIAYKLGVLRGCPIDSPKYLTKAVVH